MGLLGYKFGNAVAAKRSRFARPAQAFVSQPEPRTIGIPARGQHLGFGHAQHGVRARITWF